MTMSKNMLYPGKSNYVGPKVGMFTLLHHEGPLLEWSDDVMERVKYIKDRKAPIEVAIRLRHIVLYPKKLWSKWQEAYAKWQEVDAKRKEAYAKWKEADAKWHEVDADKILAHLKRHVKDCRWNGKEIVFT